MRVRSLGLLVGPLVTIAIIYANAEVYLAFLKNTNVINSLFNNWSNFPTGLITAIFTPDSQVFLCYNGTNTAAYCAAYFLAWYALDVELLVAYVALFFLVNLGEDVPELSLRSVYYGIMIIAISVVSNWLALYRFPGSVGPSTAAYAGYGLAYGFGIVNSIQFFRGDREGPISRKVLVGLVFGIMIAIVTTAAALSNPTAFFNVSATQKIDSEAHMICFIGGAIASIPFILRSPGEPVDL